MDTEKQGPIVVKAEDVEEVLDQAVRDGAITPEARAHIKVAPDQPDFVQGTVEPNVKK
jgi:hypothetical protein